MKYSNTSETPFYAALSITAAVAATGISRSKLYEEIAAKRLRVAKVGRRTLITPAALGEWIARCERS